MYKKVQPLIRALHVSSLAAFVFLLTFLVPLVDGAVSIAEAAYPVSTNSQGTPLIGGFILRTITAASPLELTDVSKENGVFTFSYPFALPKGRNDLTPGLVLGYNSYNRSFESTAGFGWDLGIPSITRLNKKGTNTMYTDRFFSSSLDGELYEDTPGHFVPRVQDSTFVSYTLDAQTHAWTLKDLNGNTFLFGAQSATRESDPTDASRVYRWYLERITDTHGNTITYQYTTSGNRLYPARIAYADQDSGTPLYEILFTLTPRAGSFISFASGFKITSDQHVSVITIAVGGSATRTYTLAYDQTDMAADMLLSITEKGIGEDGAEITLPPTQFSYSPRSVETTPSASWKNALPGSMRASDGSSPYVYADINGDGLPDLLYADRGEGAAYKKVYLNTGSGFTQSSSWELPGDDYFTFKYGATALDVNNDGRADLVRGLRYYIGSSRTYVTYRMVLLNTGSGWAYARNWNMPDVFLDITGQLRNPDKGIAFGDVNGDGLVDLMKTGDGGGVFLNTGSSWERNTYWTLPSYINFENNHAQPYDANNDGLVDILWVHNTSYGLFLNNGKGGFAVLPSWEGLSPFYSNTSDYGYRVLDLNNDGLPDIAHTDGGQKEARINSGHGWQGDPASAIFPSSQFQGTFLAHTDLNGDGLADFIINNNVSLAVGKRPHLLTSITASAGGITTIDYKQTPLYMNGSTRANPELPLVLDTVSRVTHTGTGGDPVSTTYAYEGGSRYLGTFNGAPDNQFAGFAVTTETDTAGNTTKTYRHQGNGNDSASGEIGDAREKIGFAYRIVYRNAQGALLKETMRTWAADTITALPGGSFVKLTQETERAYAEDGSHQDRATAYHYADNGLVSEETNYGEVSAANDGSFTDNTSDTIMRRTYQYTERNGALTTLPAEEKLFFGAESKAHTKYYYDQLPFGMSGLGDRTKTEQYTGEAWITSEKTYTTKGLVESETDPRDFTTSYIYDTKQLYPIRITNPLGHVVAYTYDYSSGKTLTKTDQNGAIFSTTYDALDRVLREEVPDPESMSTPPTRSTLRTFAYTDTPSAVRVKETAYFDASGEGRDTLRYYDGLNRLLQTRTEMANTNQYAVIDYAYDANGNTMRETLPYTGIGAARSELSAAPSALVTSFTYDALKRKLSETTVLGTTRYNYDGWHTTITDPLNHRKVLFNDARGNLSRVDEYNGASTYTTRYTWDARPSLVGLTDTLGNVRTFTYDQLGRRLSATDLHAPADATFGIWTYAYDNAGNITRSEDPNGHITTYAYDALNRTTTEDTTATPGVEVSYSYDACASGVGRLCGAIAGGVQTSYAYNPLGAKQQEVRTINSTSYTSTFRYNQAGDITEYTYPDGAVVRYLFNSVGQVAEIDKKESGETFTPVVTNITYGPHGSVVSRKASNGVETVQTFNKQERYRLGNIKTFMSGL